MFLKSIIFSFVFVFGFSTFAKHSEVNMKFKIECVNLGLLGGYNYGISVINNFLPYNNKVRTVTRYFSQDFFSGPVCQDGRRSRNARHAFTTITRNQTTYLDRFVPNRTLRVDLHEEAITIIPKSNIGLAALNTLHSNAVRWDFHSTFKKCYGEGGSNPYTTIGRQYNQSCRRQTIYQINKFKETANGEAFLITGRCDSQNSADGSCLSPDSRAMRLQPRELWQGEIDR